MKSPKTTLVHAAVCAVLVLSSCSQATGGSGGSDGPVSGKIDNQSFTTLAASASPSQAVPGSFNVSLFGGTDYPFVYFSVLPEAHTYTVTHLGDGLSVSAYLTSDGFEQIGFDSGTVTVTTVDTEAGVIEGTFANVKTDDNESRLSGQFSAEIQVE